ncbi:hypothetical protein [Shewanella denitrificans]|jgi:Ca2+/Na+ antiporter|uniref:hypothetical protein n=1 Tax=Shewanella denitrificans TaxID=192073 RepID=UPI00059E1558|nr:hypothetical protein [Shewanella denitrificans]
MKYFLWVLYLFLLAVSTVTLLVGELVIGVFVFLTIIAYVNFVPQVKSMRNDSKEFNDHILFFLIFSFMISFLGTLFPQYATFIMWFWIVVYIFKSLKLDKYFKKNEKNES